MTINKENAETKPQNNSTQNCPNWTQGQSTKIVLKQNPKTTQHRTAQTELWYYRNIELVKPVITDTGSSSRQYA
jgi:hypothetical protein